jgi:SAM-dependent methyltransferase
LSDTVSSIFDDIADVYDRYRLGYASDVFDALREYGLPPAPRVLDVGCGTGFVAEEMTRRGAAVTGIDVSGEMIERARTRVPEATFLQGRAEALPFADASFDVVTCAQTFHWLDQPMALAELARVLRPGGIVAVWWKGLMRGDTMRRIRDEVAREIGLEPPADLLVSGFEAFENSRFVDRRLRVIPWRVTLTLENFLGYEGARGQPRNAYGARLDDYLERLKQRLSDGSTDVSLSYTHLLYLGRAPERRT